MDNLHIYMPIFRICHFWGMTPFMWTEYQQASFEKLKFQESRKDYVVYNDASHTGLGCLLMQDDKIMAYTLRQLKLRWKLWYLH
ncbi:Retrovirus-related Pol polyprotein from transposon 17.6 [Gossypium australe]|uniref:Retrovirus-related Pol polyprotein from transposon 17.6 n=1 Tax=Gossypium australe TaxID=47621 RepID=A0A5B6VWJ1_9ROSI|nr:Retrovirus-related Pol polyprotein from transposon 17.6 [Gossypium australe]